VIMPSFNYNALADSDIAAIVGYLRNLEPVRNEIPPVSFNAVAKVMMAMGAFGPGSIQEPITAPKVVLLPVRLNTASIWLLWEPAPIATKRIWRADRSPFPSPARPSQRT